jgi:hypothetical protein
MAEEEVAAADDALESSPQMPSIRLVAHPDSSTPTNAAAKPCENRLETCTRNPTCTRKPSHKPKARRTPSRDAFNAANPAEV